MDDFNFETLKESGGLEQAFKESDGPGRRA
jgi:hypothetical protein